MGLYRAGLGQHRCQCWHQHDSLPLWEFPFAATEFGCTVAHIKSRITLLTVTSVFCMLSARQAICRALGFPSALRSIEALQARVISLNHKHKGAWGLSFGRFCSTGSMSEAEVRQRSIAALLATSQKISALGGVPTITRSTQRLCT